MNEPSLVQAASLLPADSVCQQQTSAGIGSTPASNDLEALEGRQRRAELTLQRRLDSLALVQLRAVAAQQAQELDALRAELGALRAELAWAKDSAECWREDAISALNAAADATDGHVGMTIAGHYVVTHGARP